MHLHENLKCQDVQSVENEICIKMIPCSKDSMDIDTFLQLKPAWAYEPCLYVVKQMFPGNNAHRCGATGTQLHKDADLVFGADRSGSLTGLTKGVW